MFRSLIVWFMLLAVPFQGFASATMLACAPSSGAPMAHMSAAVDSSHHDHGAMLSDQATAHDHHAATADAGGSPAADGPSSEHHAGEKCSSCATCSLGASMAPSAASDVPVQAVYSESIPFYSGHYPTVDLAFPERPPQSSLA